MEFEKSENIQIRNKNSQAQFEDKNFKFNENKLYGMDNSKFNMNELKGKNSM